MARLRKTSGFTYQSTKLCDKEPFARDARPLIWIGIRVRIALSIEGLPRQDDLKGLKLPATTSSPFTAVSPLLKALQGKPKPKRDCPR